MKSGLFNKYYDALIKISFAQIRFMYRKLLGDRRELIDEDKIVMRELYDFMDKNYPEWVNIDQYNVGVMGDKSLDLAVNNIVFNNNKTIYSSSFEKVSKQDIIFIDLIDESFYEDISKWKEKYQDILKQIEKCRIEKRFVVVKLLKDKSYKRDIDSINEVYKLYEQSKANIEVLEFYIDEDEVYESLIWNLSDELLDILKNKTLLTC